MATYKNIKSENEVTIKGLASVTGTASSGEGKFYFKTDGKPYALWEDGAEVDLSSDATGPFENASGVVRNTGTHISDDFVFGSTQLGDTGSTDHDKRFFFDKSKGSFRAGQVSSNYWDDANVGGNSVAFGYETRATGTYSYAEGRETTASNNASHAEGWGTTASGSVSHAQGQNTTASGSYSHAEGSYSNAYLLGMHSHASSRFSTPGDSQYSRVVLLQDTTDGTESELYMSALMIRMVLPENRTWGFEIQLSARQTAGTAGTVGDSKIFKFEGGIKRDEANNTAIIGSVTETIFAEDAGAAGWSVSIEADDTNEALVIKATGEINKTIHWVATTHLTEVG